MILCMPWFLRSALLETAQIRVVLRGIHPLVFSYYPIIQLDL